MKLEIPKSCLWDEVVHVLSSPDHLQEVIVIITQFSHKTSHLITDSTPITLSLRRFRFWKHTAHSPILTPLLPMSMLILQFL